MASPNSARKRSVFSQQMRKATRDVHAVSDALVNAKLLFALSNNAVWADGLLVFYEIFRFLEDAMLTLKSTPVHQFNIEGLSRTEAFEKDLAYYLGENWTKSYTPRASVVKYLMHLRHLEETEPVLLVAYIYHLYMGLLSGGQVLRKKRIMASKLSFFSNSSQNDRNVKGYSVTDFGRHSLYSLKQKLRTTLDELALTLDDETKLKLLEESRKVFLLNNEIIKSVRGTTLVILYKLFVILVVLLILYSCYIFYRSVK